MSQKRSLVFLALCQLIHLSSFSFGLGSEPQGRPNIILAMADDQGWGDVAYNGHPVLKTPVLDEMAATGLRFDRFYAAAPVCSPTRGSVMTGRHPNRFGCFRWGYALRPEETTVAEVLRKAGYVCGHFGKWHLGSLRKDSPTSPGQSGFDEWLSSPNFFEIDPWMSHNGRAVRTHGEGSQVTVEASLDFIRSAVRNERPFLAVIWFGSPHSPHEATQEDLRLYEGQPSEMQHFLGEVTAMDRAMGTLRTELRKLGISENTLLWYTSDNGAIEQGSTGGLSGGKGTLWEGGIRVPAIIEWPARIATFRKSDIPCGTVDIFPTLLDVAGLEIPEQVPLDGVSLLGLIDDQGWNRTKPLGFWDYPAKGGVVRSSELLEELAREQASGKEVSGSEETAFLTGGLAEDVDTARLPGHSAWIDGNYKLHRIPGKKGAVEYQLFNLLNDPKEQADLATREKNRVERMKQSLAAWQESVVHSLKGEDYR